MQSLTSVCWISLLHKSLRLVSLKAREELRSMFVAGEKRRPDDHVIAEVTCIENIQ